MQSLRSRSNVVNPAAAAAEDKRRQTVKRSGTDQSERDRISTGLDDADYRTQLAEANDRYETHVFTFKSLERIRSVGRLFGWFLDKYGKSHWLASSDDEFPPLSMFILRIACLSTKPSLIPQSM